MNKSVRILVITKNHAYERLYHDFFAQSGCIVYPCDAVSHAMLQMLMYPGIGVVLLDTAFPNVVIKKFLQTLGKHAEWKDKKVILFDSADKGDILRKIFTPNGITYSSSVDPVDIRKLFNGLKLDKQ